MGRSRSLATLLTVALAAAACDTRVGLSGATGGDGGPLGVPGGGAAQSPIVGEWSMILVNLDGSGALMSSSETRWRFDANGDASRTSIATSFVSGIQEAVRTTGTWSATSTTITIVLQNPPSGTLVLPWRIEPGARGSVLVLGTLRFVKRPG